MCLVIYFDGVAANNGQRETLGAEAHLLVTVFQTRIKFLTNYLINNVFLKHPGGVTAVTQLLNSSFTSKFYSDT